MTTANASTYTCRQCETPQEIGNRCCSNCGLVLTEADLQQQAAQQWAAHMRPLKVAVTISAVFTVYLLWYAAFSF